MTDTKIGAFFDFDETLLEVTTGRLGLKFMWENRLVSRSFILKVLVLNEFYKAHFISEETMSRSLLKFYKGKILAEFEQGAPGFYHEYIKSSLAPRIMERLRDHQAQGHVTVLISGSVRYLLKPVAEDLGFDHLLCTDLEETNGRLTGRPAGPPCIGDQKRVLALDLAERENLNLAASYAYGNHQADIPLLESVGCAFAVEPTQPLRAAAEKNGWPILTFR